jgi:hypothetical protein
VIPTDQCFGAGDSTCLEVDDGLIVSDELFKLNRSGGVVERSKDFRRDSRGLRVRQYFYGPDPAAPLAVRADPVLQRSGQYPAFG